MKEVLTEFFLQTASAAIPNFLLFLFCSYAWQVAPYVRRECSSLPRVTAAPHLHSLFFVFKQLEVQPNRELHFSQDQTTIPTPASPPTPHSRHIPCQNHLVRISLNAAALLAGVKYGHATSEFLDAPRCVRSLCSDILV